MMKVSTMLVSVIFILGTIAGVGISGLLYGIATKNTIAAIISGAVLVLTATFTFLMGVEIVRDLDQWEEWKKKH